MTPADPSRSPWRKSTHSSQDGNCVEVSGDCPARAVAVRDTQDRDGFVLRLSGTDWHRFTASLR